MAILFWSGTYFHRVFIDYCNQRQIGGKMRRWTGKCQRCFKTSNTYTMSWYSVALICLECSEKEEERKDIQDVKDADALDYLRRHNLPTESLQKQISKRKEKEQK